jgi:hypothetical protein
MEVCLYPELTMYHMYLRGSRTNKMKYELEPAESCHIDAHVDLYSTRRVMEHLQQEN